MSEYWVSNKRWYCKFCKVWIADNKVQRAQHEKGDKHKENMQQFLQKMREDNEKKREAQAKVEEELRQINEAAERAHYRDLNPYASGRGTQAETYGTFDAYGGWYDGHGHYYLWEKDKWTYIGFFPNKDYVPGSTSAAGDEETGDKENDATPEPQAANEIGDWVEVKPEEMPQQAREPVHAIKIRKKAEKRPGAVDSDDEAEAKAYAASAPGDRNDHEKEPVQTVTFKKSSRGKRKLRERS